MSNLREPVDGGRTYRTTVLLVAAHAALWVVWLLGLFFFVPRCERIFRDLGMKLPSMTELVISLTHGIVPFALLVVLTFLVIDGAVYSRLRKMGGRVLWSSLMTVLPVIAILLTAVAVWEPTIKVLEGITKRP